MKRELPSSLKLKGERRDLSCKDMRIDSEKRRVEFSFSSELPVERSSWEIGSYKEVLSHDQGCADFSRLNNGAQLLFNHDWDKVLGVIESAEIRSDRRAYCASRFSENEEPSKMFKDVLDGICRNVSFGYRVNELQLLSVDGDMPTYLATKWEVYEISIVTVPADPTVGIGRNAEMDLERDVPISRNITANAAVTSNKGTTMTEEEKAAAKLAEKNTREANEQALKTASASATTEERARVSEILAMGEFKHVPKLAAKLVSDGASIAEARSAINAEVAKNPSGEDLLPVRLDLTEKEREGYSLVRAIRASVAAMKGEGQGWKDAGFELECSQEIAKRTRKETQGFYMPVNIAMSPEMRAIAARMGKGYGRRNASASAYAIGATPGAGTTGGTLVDTALMASEFIDMLRNKGRVMQAGARLLSGLVGNVDIPRQTSASTAYWVAEGVDVTESEGASDKLSFTPKTIGARGQITRSMLMQSTPDIEVLVRDDLAQVLALGIDLAAVAGSGDGGQPKGVLNLASVGSVVGGAAGAALTIDHMIDLETAVMDENISEDGCSYMVNPQTVGFLKKLKATNGTYLWTNNPIGQRGPTPGEINGYPVYRTKQLTAAGSKGGNTNLSSIIFGDWTQLFIAEWGVLEILPNPFGSGYASGALDLRALQTVDVQVRHEKAFAVMTDAQATYGHTYSA